MNPEHYVDLVRAALREDLGELGDVTSEAIFHDERCSAVLISKDTGVLAGASLFEAVFHEVDPHTNVTFYKRDGDVLLSGDQVAKVNGMTRAVLAAERVALNFISFLSGIATKAASYVAAAGEGKVATILDTRKTVPGYRALSKYAVRIGGARNHRMGLYDMVLIKDNHIDMAGSLTKAVEAVRSRWEDRFPIEVECRTVAEVQEALACRVDIVMLDNMDDATIARSVSVCDHSAQIEVSGNVDLDAVRRLSRTGVDYISVGSLTHSVKSFDFSLKKAPELPDGAVHEHARRTVSGNDD